jgi:hypothetical protein
VWTRSQHRVRRNLFGWVNPLSGARGLMTAAHGNTAAFVQFLEQILGAHPTPLIQLWVDNASWHKGEVVTTWLKTQGWLKLFYPCLSGWLPSESNAEARSVQRDAEKALWETFASSAPWRLSRLATNRISRLLSSALPPGMELPGAGVAADSL